MAKFHHHDIRMIQQLNYRYELVSPHVSKITVPNGLPYSAYSHHDGCPTTESLMLFLESSRPFNIFSQDPISKGDNSLGDHYKLVHDGNAFLILVSVNINFENRNLPFSRAKPPLTIMSTLERIKTSTFTTAYEIRSSSGDPFVTAKYTIILLNSKTRKPQPLPDWWTEKYSYLNVNEQSTSHMPTPIVGQSKKESSSQPTGSGHNKHVLEENVVQSEPKRKFSYKRTVLPSDIDSFNHTNNVSYFRYCMDCLMLERNSDGEVEGYPIKEPALKFLQLNFKRETGVNDELDIVMYKQTNKNQEIDFEIYKDDVVVCNVRFGFHDD